MSLTFPLNFQLADGTHVLVKNGEAQSYAIHLTRLNSEKHNFIWHADTNEIEESYETRFDQWQNEAVTRLQEMLGSEK
jgi:hypothetical protein